MKIRNHHAGCCGFTPVRPDGTQWSHVLGLPAGGSVHADSAREVLEEVIDGYADLPDDAARAAARERHAVEIAARHQELRITQAIVEGAARESDPDDAALIALLREVRGRPIGLAAAGGEGDAAADGSSDAAGTGEESDVPGTGEEAPGGPTWPGAIRLVCLTTAYAPYGDLPAPRGNVDWIDPREEEGYLVSLRRVGALDYWSEAVYS